MTTVPIDWQKNQDLMMVIEMKWDRSRITIPISICCRFLIILSVLSYSVVSMGADDYLTFFSTNYHGESTLSSVEENGDTRNFSAEAVFIESATRINRALTDAEKKQLARIKTFSETFNQVRYRNSNSSLFDFSFKGRKIENAQVTSFFIPDQFNEVEIAEYGLAYQHAWQSEESDVVLRSSLRRTERIGLIEFLPKSTDDVDTIELNLAYSQIETDDTSITFYATIARQDIELNIADPFDRSRDIAAFAFVTGGERTDCVLCEGEYSSSSQAFPIFPLALENIFSRKYNYTSTGFHGGYAYDKEVFGAVEVTRSDLYFGYTASLEKMLVTIEPAIFTSEVSDDASQDIDIFRVSVVPTFQNLFDRRISLQIPFIIDRADEGPDYFDSWRTGFRLGYLKSWGSKPQSELSLAIDIVYKDYLNIDRNDTLWNVAIALKI